PCPYRAIAVTARGPRACMRRGRRRKGIKYFGPCARVWAIKDTLDLLLKAFPMRTCTPGVYRRAERSGRPCLLGYIDKCAAPCVGHIGKEEHRELARSKIGRAHV